MIPVLAFWIAEFRWTPTKAGALACFITIVFFRALRWVL